MRYTKLKPQTLLMLKDMQTALQYGSVRADRRIQVVMPSEVVSALDDLYPDTDRSKLLTQLAIDFILQKQHFVDRPELANLVSSEQSGLDSMLQYLEAREKNS